MRGSPSPPSSPQVLYLVVGSGWPYFFKSIDGAATWTELKPEGNRPYCQCSYDLALAVNPNIPHQVFFGGVPLYLSSDGGKSWTQLTSPHVDYHALVFSRGRLYAGSDGGVFWSADGRNWQQLNTGLEITQFYSVTSHPQTSGILFGGTQDNGTLLYSGRREWQEVLGGDGGKPLIDPVEPHIVYGSAQWSAFYFVRSDDGGLTFEQKTRGLSSSDRGAFLLPVAMDPEDSDSLLLATNRVYLSNNRAESWHEIGGSLRGGVWDDIDEGVYTAVAMGRGIPERIYAGTSKGHVRMTDTGGLGWYDRVEGLPQRYVADLAIDPLDSRIVYVAFSGYGTGHVFKSTNTGIDWMDLSLGLPDVPVSRILLLDTTPRTLVIGTDLGVYFSLDDGRNWHEFRDGLPNAAVSDLAIRPDGSFVAATYGRGIFTAPALPDPDPGVLRLGTGGRFEVTLAWRTVGGQEGEGRAFPLTEDTGAFWFFDEQNLEVVVKVLDGCGVNGKAWVFAAGLTDVEVTMTVTDRETGATKTYQHVAGKPFAPLQDTGALDSCPNAASLKAFRATDAEPSSCSPSGTSLCLGPGGRFRVEATWATAAGNSGLAHGVSLTEDTGYLWFFDPSNVEALVKVVNGCGLNDRHWVFAGGLTNVEIVLRVTDGATGEVREYRNPQGQPYQPVQDTNAFPGCP